MGCGVSDGVSDGVGDCVFIGVSGCEGCIGGCRVTLVTEKLSSSWSRLVLVHSVSTTFS